MRIESASARAYPFQAVTLGIRLRPRITGIATADTQAHSAEACFGCCREHIQRRCIGTERKKAQRERADFAATWIAAHAGNTSLACSSRRRCTSVASVSMQSLKPARRIFAVASTMSCDWRSM